MSYRKLLIFSFLLSITVAYSQDGTDANSYLSFIGNQYEAISKDMLSYTSAINHGKGARKIEKRRNELMLQLKESERNMRKMKPFKGSYSLRDSIASYFRLCGIVLNEEYGKILNMEDIAEQSYDAMEAYLLAKEKANDKLNDASAAAHAQYMLFASNNEIKIVETESKLSQKIEASKKVNDYYNKVYLLFFKSYKNEAYLMAAIDKGNAGAMEQTKNTLLASATEDLEKLGSIPSFEGDATLKNACQKLLGFYKTETSKISGVIDFYVQKKFLKR